MICEVPISLVSLVDKDRQWFKSHTGLEARETPRDFAFCAHAILEEEILYIPDSTKDERFHDNPLVTGPPFVKFYTGIPLTVEGKYKVGTLCIIDNKPKELTEVQLEALKCLARQVESQLKLRLKLKEISLEKENKEKTLVEKSNELENRIMIENTQEAARIGSWQVDLITNKCIWSKMTYKIHEIDPSVEIHVEDGINFYTEEYRPIIIRLVQEGIEKKKGWDAELKIQTAKNNIRWVRAIGYPVVIDNQLVRLEGTFQDITESKEIQDKATDLNQRLTLALQASNVGVWEWNLTTNEIIWDRQMISLHGITEENFKGEYTTLIKHLHPNDQDRIIQEFQDCVNFSNKCDTQFRVILPNGKVRTLRALAEILFGDDNKPFKMIGVNWDISDVIAKEEILKKAKDKSESALKAKSTFLANMSHEIRTPLNGIIGLTSIVLDSDLEKEVQTYVESIRDCGDSLLTIINDILDISKIDSGMLKFEHISINLQELINSTVFPFLPKAKEKGIDIIVNVRYDVPDNFFGDPVRIRQVLFNLLGNAVKFTMKGSVEVLVSASSSGEKTKLHFAITDTGIGIAEENLDKLFLKFEQLDSTITRNFGGTGLGLSICKNLIEMMGGSIKVNSTLGKGSCFSFKLAVIVDSREEEIIEEKYAIKDPPPSELSILIVEDNKINKLVISKILKALNYSNADYAKDGLEAVEMVSNKKYDLVFMDIQMPIMNGYEATSIIRERLNSKCFIVGLSANAFEEDKKKAFSCGMNDYIEKPIKKETIEKFIREFTANKLKAV